MNPLASSPLEDDHIDTLVDGVIDYFTVEGIFADEFEEDLMGTSFFTERGDPGMDDDFINTFAA